MHAYLSRAFACPLNGELHLVLLCFRFFAPKMWLVTYSWLKMESEGAMHGGIRTRHARSFIFLMDINGQTVYLAHPWCVSSSCVFFFSTSSSCHRVHRSCRVINLCTSFRVIFRVSIYWRGVVSLFCSWLNAYCMSAYWPSTKRKMVM